MIRGGRKISAWSWGRSIRIKKIAETNISLLVGSGRNMSCEKLELKG